MLKLSIAWKMLIMGILQLCAFGFIFTVGTYNHKRWEAETEQKIAVLTKLNAEDARQLVIKELQEKKQAHAKMRLW